MNRKSNVRSQYGMAMWLKVVLGIFGACLLLAVAGSIFLFSFIKDMTDPKKTEDVANKIVTMVSPLPPPFEYGRVNLAGFGFSMALINNTESQALFFLIKSPRKDATDSAQKVIEKVSKGEAGLPDTTPGGGGASSTAKNNMKVTSHGTLDAGGSQVYYVIGTSTLRRGGQPKGTPEVEAKEVETFLGGADPADGKTATYIMGQQPDPAKHLSIEEIEAFLATIKKF